MKRTGWIGGLLAAAVLLGGAPGYQAATGAAADMETPLETIAGAENTAGFAYESEAAMLADMRPAAENEAYSLYFHPQSLAVALADKRTGAVFTSNPYNAARDPNFTGDIQSSLVSQVAIHYIDNNNQTATLWSGPDCAALGQYTAKLYPDGVAFEMSIGKEQKQLLVPAAFTVETYERITGQLGSRAKRRMNLFYSLTDLASVADEQERARLLAAYPPLKTEPLYICNANVSRKEKNEIDGYMAEAGYTREEYEAVAGQFHIEVEEEIFANFKLTIRYRLTPDGLRVTIPHDGVSYDEEHFQLASITVLEYFGADLPQEGGEGYLFIPDGSGAILSLQDPSPNRRPLITGQVYGRDGAASQTEPAEGEPYYLPVFGIVRNNRTALFAVIESGDAGSEITAKLGEPNGRYYTVYNTFSWTSREYVTLEAKVASNGSTRRVYLCDKNGYRSDMTLAFYPLTGEKASYSGMAAVYRAVLLEKGMRQEGAAGPVFQLQTLGTADYTTSLLGFRYRADAEFTSYRENMEMVRYFQDRGVEDIHLSLLGYEKYGLDSGAANRVRLSGALGGARGFSELLDWCAAENVGFSVRSNMLFVGKDRWFDGFSARRDSSRTLQRVQASVSRMQPDTLEYENPRYCLSPRMYERFFERFFADCGERKIGEVVLGEVGRYLNSDFSQKEPINREQTAARLAQLLGAQKDRLKLSFDGANAYVLPYAAAVTDLGMTHSGYAGETAAVPFVQMVLSGSVAYSSAPINLKADKQTELLRCIASGTSPTYLLAYKNVDRLKQSAYSYYYAVDFQYLRERALEGYTYVADALAAAEGSRLVAHEVLADGVTVSTFENGAEIAVNCNRTAYAQGAIRVEAQSYTVLQKEHTDGQ